MSGQPAIEDHALVGDCRSAALVSREGTIDFLCWPRFDSPAIFAAILDDTRGGCFRVAPEGSFTATHAYAPGSNVLVTRFETRLGRVELTDFMPALTEAEKRTTPLPEHVLFRLARCVEGEVTLSVLVEPRPNFGLETPRARKIGCCIRFETRQGLLHLHASHELRLEGDRVVAQVRLRAGESLELAFSASSREIAVLPPLGEWAHGLLARTLAFWRAFVARATYDGPYRDEVVRSVLLLKLLSYAPSGAMVAAPTTSLPERPGGTLNWDYRYCWLRDSALTARAGFGLGFDDEAEAFVSWLLTTTSLTRPRVSVFYDVFGREPPPEKVLPHLTGYRGARPVRVGNGARDQLQLDIYGELVDAAAHFCKAGGTFDGETSSFLLGVGSLVARSWRQADDGIWEIRGTPRQFTHSKVLCWVALDRLIDLAEKKHLPRARARDLELFRRERAAIRDLVETRGVDPVRGTYVRTLGGTDMDASLLLLPWYGYVEASSPRMRRTYARIRSELGSPGGLLKRYQGELTRGEGAFGICSFWAVEHLALGGGTLAEAEQLFQSLLRYRNAVGLYAEEIDEQSGAGAGNFPQAYTHVGLISAALTIEERRRGAPAKPAARVPPRAVDQPAEERVI